MDRLVVIEEAEETANLTRVIPPPAELTRETVIRQGLTHCCGGEEPR